MKTATTIKNVLTGKLSRIAACVPIVLLSVLLWSFPAGAHEFWLEPTDFSPPTGRRLQVKAVVGQYFVGESLVYLRKDFPSVTKFANKRPVRLTGTDGDSPALDVFIRERGPQLVVLKSRVYDLEFTGKEKFIEYLNLEGYHDLAGLAAQKLRDPIEIWEEYERNAKLLVFGDGRRDGRDYRTGLDFEFVLEDNFDRLRVGNTVRLRLLKEGKPLAATPVKVLRRADPKAALFLKTDAGGWINVNLDRAGGWLLNAVHFTKIEVVGDGEIKSIWASYVFPVGPARK